MGRKEELERASDIVRTRLDSSERYRKELDAIAAKYLFGWSSLGRLEKPLIRRMFGSITLDKEGKIIINNEGTRKWLCDTINETPHTKVLLKHPELISQETKGREQFIKRMRTAINRKAVPMPRPSGSLAFAGPKSFRSRRGRTRGPSGGRRPRR